MSRTLELDVTDNGTIQATITQAKRFSRKALKEIDESTQEYAIELRDEVRKNAEGRPGPRKVSGAYWSSIRVETASSGVFRRSFSRSVTSDHPAALRLENGFIDVDALGRHYNQPPYKHWEPAIVAVGNRWLASFGYRLPDWWKVNE